MSQHFPAPPRGPRTPPPHPNRALIVLGWVFTILGILILLSRFSQAGRGGDFYPSGGGTAGTIGAVVGTWAIITGSLVAGHRLRTSHRRAMDRWRRDNGAA